MVKLAGAWAAHFNHSAAEGFGEVSILGIQRKPLLN